MVIELVHSTEIKYTLIKLNKHTMTYYSIDLKMICFILFQKLFLLYICCNF